MTDNSLSSEVSLHQTGLCHLTHSYRTESRSHKDKRVNDNNDDGIELVVVVVFVGSWRNLGVRTKEVNLWDSQDTLLRPVHDTRTFLPPPLCYYNGLRSLPPFPSSHNYLGPLVLVPVSSYSRVSVSSPLQYSTFGKSSRVWLPVSHSRLFEATLALLWSFVGNTLVTRRN